MKFELPLVWRTGAGWRFLARAPQRPAQAGAPGDLYLDLDVRPDPHLRRAGDDIELELPVTIPEAVLGAKVEVPTVEGPVTMTIPPGTSSGARLRLRGRGIKRPDGTRGNQIARVGEWHPRSRPTTPRRASCSSRSRSGPRAKGGSEDFDIPFPHGGIIRSTNEH